MMWPTTASPTVDHMEDLGFNTDFWWAWNYMTVDNAVADGNLKLGIWGDPDEDLAVYNPRDDGLTDHISSMFRKHKGREQTSPVTGMFNGQLVNLQGEIDPFVIMSVGQVEGWITAYRLQCPFWFNDQGFFENSRRLGRYFDEEFYQNDTDYSDGIADIRLQFVHPIEKSIYMEDAAKAVVIKSSANQIVKKVTTVSTLTLAASLISLDWPNTQFLTKSKVKMQDFVIRAVTRAIL